MREAKQQGVATAPMTVEEYIQFELTADCRHEYINGQLFEMPGEKDINNEMAFAIATLLASQLSGKGYKPYLNEVKVAIPGGSKYYYPDVFITKEAKSDHNRYIKHEAELIVEIISPSTRLTDTVDKYIDYKTIPSLHYYLVVEPEITYVTVHAKNEAGEWSATLYASLNDVIPLPLLEASLPLSEVYK